ncbi:MAG TPA: bifunctional adenosylcobinamide kinase/adenosylcobinamide-phosphate guanylyltransferase [Devosia sp.]|nr:bifunctional adenosylcobinamide kinase/adenosylcobinamide-phosphate guanylyltransferase [Devosia sp.]
MHMSGHILILGGARSGKTSFAERMAMRAGETPLYLATAQALDDEMLERVKLHQQQRHKRFATLEEPLDLATALKAGAREHDVILVDCITLWITNMLGENVQVAKAVDELISTLTEIDSARVIVVSNEVGLGIVPDNPLARTFRDLSGAAHQRLAEICGEVHFIIAGLPMTLKGPRLTESSTEMPLPEG